MATVSEKPDLRIADRKYLAAIRKLRKQMGFPPTLQEIAEELGVSRPTVHERIARLLEMGVLRRTENKVRSIEVVRFTRQPAKRSA